MCGMHRDEEDGEEKSKLVERERQQPQGGWVCRKREESGSSCVQNAPQPLEKTLSTRTRATEG